MNADNDGKAVLYSVADGVASAANYFLQQTLEKLSVFIIMVC
ncbi:hypothetical protein [Niallia taxi]|nr:hypothetical protein [Niallia taxi]